MNESAYAAGEQHRCVEAETLEFHPFPDSIFQHIQSCYGGDSDAIHRCFSLARLYKAQMYVEERIPATGQLHEDVHEFVYNGYPGGDVRQVGEDYVKKVSGKPCDSVYVSMEKGYLEFKAQRISFWKKNLLDSKQEDRPAALAEIEDDDCIGYVILVKAGCVKGKPDKIRWIVYEAILDGGENLRGVMPRSVEYSFRVGSRIRKIRGWMYCQQNGRTAVCAHAAVRTLLSALLPAHDISYKKISELANYKGGSVDRNMIRAVFETLGFSVHDWSVDRSKNGDASNIPLYHCLYLGVESRGGSLFGFDVKNCDDQGDKHIIPVFGHTFNKHIWVNEASGYYFKSDIKVPRSFISDNWVSTFIAHDDNVGPNVSIPRFYIDHFALSSVITVLPHPDRRKYAVGVDAEEIAVDWLRKNVVSFLEYMKTEKYADNDWLDRLKAALTPGEGQESADIAKVVLRSLLISREEYLRHLRQDRDSEGHVEDPRAIENIVKRLPEHLWMVEISFPHLFPVNERKIGEVILSAKEGASRMTRGVILIRLPSRYLLPVVEPGASVELENAPCEEMASAIQSHTPCFVFDDVRRV